MCVFPGRDSGHGNNMYRGNLEIPESLLVTRGDSGNSISTAVRATARYRGGLHARPRGTKSIIPAVPLKHVIATRARPSKASHPTGPLGPSFRLGRMSGQDGKAGSLIFL